LIRREEAKKKPIDGRFSSVQSPAPRMVTAHSSRALRSGRWLTEGLLTLALTTTATAAAAQPVTATVLDRTAVVEQARRRSWGVRVATARSGEARALREGAALPARENPSLQLRSGPRWTSDRGPVADLSLALSWPVDLSGSAGARTRHADAAAEAAEAEVRNSVRLAIGEALDLYARALGAAATVGLAEARTTLDDELVRAAGVRRAAGATGDGDVAMADAVRAEGAARMHRARAEREALRAEILAALGLDAQGATEIAGDLAPPPEPASLETLLARAERRSDVLSSEALVLLARTDVEVQRRAGLPVPRLMVQGIRENEIFVQAGVEVPLPVYQRNQTARAVSAAVAATRELQQEALRARARCEVVAAWRRSDGAARAFAAINGARGAVGESERLALRAYELGRADLVDLLVMRRAAMDAQAAQVDALVTWVRARVALDVAAGTEP
jgi:outer membrane protein, heavy metal efflux system